jgi:hypothetical protein
MGHGIDDECDLLGGFSSSQEYQPYQSFQPIIPSMKNNAKPTNL